MSRRWSCASRDCSSVRHRILEYTFHGHFLGFCRHSLVLKDLVCMAASSGGHLLHKDQDLRKWPDYSQRRSLPLQGGFNFSIKIRSIDTQKAFIRPRERLDRVLYQRLSSVRQGLKIQAPTWSCRSSRPLSRGGSM